MLKKQQNRPAFKQSYLTTARDKSVAESITPDHYRKQLLFQTINKKEFKEDSLDASFLTLSHLIWDVIIN